MNRACNFFILLIICAVFMACKAAPSQNQSPLPGPTPAPVPAPPQPPVRIGDYFPATAGSSWVYLGEGNEFAAFTREVLFTSGGQSQFKESNGGTVSTSIYDISADAVKRVYFSGETYDPQNLLSKGFSSNENAIVLQAPVFISSSWTSGNDAKRIIDMNAQVMAPAGTFSNCIKIEIKSQGSSATVYEYYGKGVGLVKREFIDGSTSVTSTLRSYKIAP